MKKFLFSLIVLFSVAAPLATQAAKPLVLCGNTGQPACTLCDFIIGVKGLIDFGSGLLITVAAVGIFIAGFMYIVSSGSPQEVGRAKGFLRASLTGFAVVVGAWFIVSATLWVISAKGNLGVENASNWYTFTCSK